MKKVLVFGTFDGLHPGHIHFLNYAKKLGDRLIVIVAPDVIARKLKNKSPHINEKERVELVSSLAVVDQAVVGDNELSSYRIIKKLQGDIICIGYDQNALAKDLQKHFPYVKIVMAKPYKRYRMHNSKMVK